MIGRLGAMRRSGLLAAAMLLALDAVPAQAQEPLRDNRAAGRVEAGTVVTLRFQDLDVAPDIHAQVFRLPDGRWGAVSGVFRGTIPLFTATGSAAGTLGHPGPGPGEFKTPAFAIGVGNQLWVVDPGNNRLTAVASDGMTVGSRTLPGSVFWAQPRADDSGLLLSGYFARRLTVARITMDKADDRFGEEASRTSDNPYVQQHVAAETPSGEIWAVARAGGSIDILRADDLGPLASTRLPDDLSLPDRHPGGSVTTERPGPLVYGVTLDSAGILWIVMVVADARWRSVADPRQRPPVDEIFDTLILAVSTRDRAILGARRMDKICLPVVDDLISCANESAATVDVLRLSVRGR